MVDVLFDMNVELIEPKISESIPNNLAVFLYFFDVLESLEVFLLAKQGVIIIADYHSMPLFRFEVVRWFGFTHCFFGCFVI